MKISVIIPNYNHASSAIKCIDALTRQKITGNHEFSIIVVDDGSTDNSHSIIHARYDQRIELIGLESNQGRCTARNTGAFQSDADYLIFIDSDCIAVGDGFIQAYIDNLSLGHDLIFGQVSTENKKFWDLLQKNTFHNRQSEFRSGQFWAYTTQNVCIRRNLFMSIGGFDTQFEKHGFEDRDLFIRLIEHGAKAAYCHAANVIHDDTISLRSVSAKMLAAGVHSSVPFGQKHPRHYALSAYAKLDCRIYPWLEWLDFLAWPFVRPLGSSDALWLESKKIPLSFRIAGARLIYGLHYLHGTVLAKSELRNT